MIEGPSAHSCYRSEMTPPILGAFPLLVLAACASGSADDPVAGQDDDLGVPADVPGAGEQPLPGRPGEVGDAGTPRDAGARDAGVTSGGDCVQGGAYCGGDKVVGDSTTLYECQGAGTPTVLEECAAGCVVSPGRDDSCAASAAGCSITSVPDAPYLKYGLHPDASNALAYLNITAGRITQTIGNASASAGTHAKDGVADGRAYSAATDLSVSGMTDAQVTVFLDQLTSVGFMPYYRKPGFDHWPSNEARHVHAVWAGAPMKLLLRNQARDFHVGKNGLASHATYAFKTWTQCWRDALWTRYLTENPAAN